MAVPAERAVTNPLVGLTEAIPDAVLDHVPPEEELLRLLVAPAHAVSAPVIGPGVTAPTVKVVVAEHVPIV